jgi:hypothetical protein
MIQAEKPAVFVLQNLNSNGVQRGSGCLGAKLSVIEDCSIFCLVDSSAVLRTDYHVVVIFVEMDHPEMVYPGITGFLFDHPVYCLFPSWKVVGIMYSIFKHGGGWMDQIEDCCASREIASIESFLRPSGFKRAL